MISENKRYIAAVDLGNSKVKVLLGNQETAFDYQVNWSENLINFLSDQSLPNIVAGVSSVRPEKFAELKKTSDLFPSVRIINVIDSIGRISNGIYTEVKGFGADRMLGLYGAMLHASPPFFTVDCGTALTINFLDNDTVFRGGAILPGIGSQLRALHEFTEQLPLPGIKRPERKIGASTEAALLAGAVGGAGGAVRWLVEQMWKEAVCEGIPQVLVTGGEAEVLLPELAGWPFAVQHYPHLVREGIADATRRILDNEESENRS